MSAGVEFQFQPWGRRPARGLLDREDLCDPSRPRLRLPFMKDPRSLGYPDHWSVRYLGPADEDHDWGGVHINSSIANQAFYLMIEGARIGRRDDGGGPRAGAACGRRAHLLSRLRPVPDALATFKDARGDAACRPGAVRRWERCRDADRAAWTAVASTSRIFMNNPGWPQSRKGSTSESSCTRRPGQACQEAPAVGPLDQALSSTPARRGRWSSGSAVQPLLERQDGLGHLVVGEGVLASRFKASMRAATTGSAASEGQLVDDDARELLAHDVDALPEGGRGQQDRSSVSRNISISAALGLRPGRRRGRRSTLPGARRRVHVGVGVKSTKARRGSGAGGRASRRDTRREEGDEGSGIRAARRAPPGARSRRARRRAGVRPRRCRGASADSRSSRPPPAWPR